jgi:hypothetical protein
MNQLDFHNDLNKYVKAKDLKNANHVVMRELGTALVKGKQDFVDLLVYSGIPADINMSDMQLVDRFIENIDKSEKLLIGSAFLVNKNNQKVGFDGEQEISDNGVKRTILVLNSYFDDTPMPESDPNEDFYATSTSPMEDDDFHNMIPGLGQAIGGILQTGGGIANKVIEGQQKKKFGATDMMQKKQDAKQQLTTQIMAQRQAEIEAKNKKAEQKAKTTKTILIVSGAVVGLIVLGVVVYMLKKKKD